MKKAIVLDRLNRKNLGARTTCKALMSIMEEADITIIETFDNDFVKKVNRKLPFEKMAEVIENSDTVEMQRMSKVLDEADYFIINGEGSMIFSVPARQELGFHYAMIFLAKKRGCKTFYINSIASPGMNGEIDDDRLNETKRFLEYCDEFVVRDVILYEFAKNFISSKVRYIPEALFDLATRYSKLSKINIPYGDMFLPFPEDSFSLGSIDLSKPYIAISGSSGLGRNRADSNVIVKYVELIKKLQNCGYYIVLVKTCGTETYLDKIGKLTEVSVVPCENNFLMLYWVLTRARVFISGRFHPSILASAGGVPCILLTSNSHKSKAFYTYFDFFENSPDIVSATLENESDINSIVSHCKQLSSKHLLRLKIKHECKRKGKISRREYIKLFKD